MSKSDVYLLPIPDRLKELRADPPGEALERLVAEAEALLAGRPPRVTDKAGTPPSGDKHDYMSLGTYWWPNPDTADGLPYVRRDGHRNPEIDNWDINRLNDMAYGARTLALAYGLTGREAFAGQAASFLRTWFLDESTRMNPHLRFGQAIPGSVTGRGIGIIDTRELCGLVTAAEYLEPAAGQWTPAETALLRAWYMEYLHWLLESEYGLNEAGQHNNHGTWYDVQAVNFAQACGETEVAVRILKSVPERRFFPQIAADGSQPHELARTLTVSYCCLNLTGFALLADAGAALGVDLWNTKGPEGQGLLPALEWMLPYAHHPETWAWPQIKAPNWTTLAYPLLLGARGSADPRFAEGAMAALGDESRSHWSRLLFGLEGA